MADDDATTAIRSTTAADGSVIDKKARNKDEAIGVDSKLGKRGLLARLWKLLIGRRDEDYEKRLHYLSKAEASIHSRMKQRAQRWRKSARNVVLISVFIEVSKMLWLDFFLMSFENVITSSFQNEY